MSDEPIVQHRPRRDRRALQQLQLLVFAVAVMGTIAVLSYYYLVPRETEFVLKQYRYAEVTTRSFCRVVSVEGTVVPRVTREVTSPAKGELSELSVKPGEDVLAGQVLGRVTAPEVEAEYREKMRELESAQAEARRLELENQIKASDVDSELEEARRHADQLSKEFEVWQKIYALGDISAADLESKRLAMDSAVCKYKNLEMTAGVKKEKLTLEVDTARHKAELARTDVDQLRKVLDSLVLVSPLSGRVLEVNASVSDQVSAGKCIVAIADLNTSYVSASIGASALSDVREGQNVEIGLLGQRYTGRVTYVAPQASGSSATVNIAVEFDTLPENPVPNSACLLDIVVGRRDDALCLPRDFYLSSGESMYIYVIDKQLNVAKKTPARFGLVDAGFIELLSGASKGDRVIVSSYDEFIDRDEVRLLPQ